jgi:hypothetical protein
MELLKNASEVLHRVRVKLYPNYLPGAEGSYIARTNSEATLSIEQVCAALKTRGGFFGNGTELTEHVRRFLDEVAYQICDGFAVNMGYFSIRPNIGGTFGSAGDPLDHAKNPITFRFRTCAALRRLADHVSVAVEGIADTAGRIDEYEDTDENSVNDVFVPGNQFVLRGNRIKAAGSDPAVGVYFVPVEDSTKAVKVTRLAVNTPTQVVGIAPSTGFAENYVEIRSQSSSSGGSLLKTPRVIRSNFVLEEI